MEKFEVEATQFTPHVILDPQKNEFLFKGVSLPENIHEFYTPIFDWLNEFRDCLDKSQFKPRGKMKFIFDLHYFNSGSARMIMDMIHKFEEITETGYEAEVVWCSEEGDAVIEDSGKEFANLSEIPFSFKTNPS